MKSLYTLRTDFHAWRITPESLPCLFRLLWSNNVFIMSKTLPPEFDDVNDLQAALDRLSDALEKIESAGYSF